MKQYNIKYSDTFYDDLKNITSHIISMTRNPQIARNFYNQTLNTITRRSFSAESYEKFIPFEGSETYYRIYFGKYIIFYTVKEDVMDIRRMLWSGMDRLKHL